MNRQLWVIFVLAITLSLLSGYLAGQLINAERLGDCLRGRITCEAQAGQPSGLADVIDRLFPAPEKSLCEITPTAIFEGCLGQGKKLDTCKNELETCTESHLTCHDNLSAHLHWEKDFGENDACIEAYDRLKKSIGK